MATLMNQEHRQENNAKELKEKDPLEQVPDVVEDRRVDSEGRVVSTVRYMRGRMLGKVN